MHEYNVYGLIHPLPPVRINISNSKHLQQLKTQVHKLKTIFCQYSDGSTMDKEELTKVLDSLSQDTEGVVAALGEDSRVSFWQFLLTVPFLLETPTVNLFS